MLAPLTVRSFTGMPCGRNSENTQLQKPDRQPDRTTGKFRKKRPSSHTRNGFEVSSMPNRMVQIA